MGKPLARPYCAARAPGRFPVRSGIGQFVLGELAYTLVIFRLLASTCAASSSARPQVGWPSRWRSRAKSGERAVLLTRMRQRSRTQPLASKRLMKNVAGSRRSFSRRPRALAAAIIVFRESSALAAGVEACKLAGGAAGAQATDAFTSALAKGRFMPASPPGSWPAVSLTPLRLPNGGRHGERVRARESRTRMQGALLSAAFVLGIVAMFVPLGVFAGSPAAHFGSCCRAAGGGGNQLLFLVRPRPVRGLDLALPAAWTNRLAQIRGNRYKGAFLLGLRVAIAAPCSGPVLTGILTWIAKTQSAGLGALAMGTFALGLGAPFFLVGAFALQLPKSGRWMVHIKSLLGIVLVVVALYFLSTAFPVIGDWARRSTGFFVIASVAVGSGSCSVASIVRSTSPGLTQAAQGHRHRAGKRRNVRPPHFSGPTCAHALVASGRVHKRARAPFVKRNRCSSTSRPAVWGVQGATDRHRFRERVGARPGASWRKVDGRTTRILGSRPRCRN